MCFSANASFGAGVVLTVIGVASIKKVQHPSQLLFASIPLFFAAQQITEGFLWLALRNPDALLRQQFLTYIFLFFAQVVWPLWVPIALLLLEKQATRKNIQRLLVGIGVVISVYLAYCLMTYRVEAKIIEHHISYIQDYPVTLRGYGAIFYIFVTIFPPIFSHIRRMWLLGVTILLSFILAVAFYEYYVISVWCFFASIVSVSVYLLMPGVQNAHQRHLTKNAQPSLY